MTKNFKNLAILMSTYNGERYLREQLDSLLNQSCDGWTLIVRDDGSTDCTVKILYEYEIKFPGKILLVRDNFGNLGIKESFFSLLRMALDYDLVMFCDQDDVWLPEKIEKFIHTLSNFPSQPLLILGDLTVVDEDLQTISKSFWKKQKLTDMPQFQDWRYVVTTNFVTGCSCMFNSQLFQYILNYSNLPLLHDHILAIASTRHGRVIRLAEPTILYRQHSNNDQGAKGFHLGNIGGKILKGVFFSLPKYYFTCKELELSFVRAIWLKITLTVFRIWG